LTGGVSAGAGKPVELLIHNTMIPNHSHLIEGISGGKAGVAGRFQRLRWNELVKRGDFVEDGNQGFEPWAGPGGFRADAFVKPIYRRRVNRKM
jgi:hypothetical protein